MDKNLKQVETEIYDRDVSLRFQTLKLKQKVKSMMLANLNLTGGIFYAETLKSHLKKQVNL